MSLSAIEKESFSKGQLAGLILLAYLFSLLIRMIWVYQMGGVDGFHWNGQLMINTNDGYFFASGAQEALYGMHESNPRVPELYKTATITLTAFAAKYLGLSLDTVILYMPAIVSSLVVIPIVLIGRLYGATLLGFCAALLGSVAWSYYNRTMVGYFDTDMFSAMAPMFILYFLLGTAVTEKLHFALLGALSVLIYPYLYDQGRAVVYAMGLMYMVYMLLFHRKEEFTYSSILLISLGLMGWLHWGIKLALVAAAYGAIRQQLLKPVYTRYLALAAALAFLATSNMFMIIWGKVLGYYQRGVEESGLKFFQVSQTVREAGRIPFEMMANRISGSIPGVLAALVGYGLLLYKRKEFMLALPLIGIGVFSLWGGLRFTVYAVPVAAISAVYLFYVLADYLENRYARGGIVAVLTALMLYPNITHIIGYKVPTVFSKPEVEVLDRLKQVGTDKDYVVTWWDYGYPIWYYAGKNTLIDGGKHHHDNFIVSEILTTPAQQEAARLSRIATETYVASGYNVVADTLFRNHTPEQVNVSDYLDQLRYGDVELPAKSRDVYLFLPLRMIDIFPTVKLFSNLDLETGAAGPRPFFYTTQRFKDEGSVLQLGNGISLLKQEGALQIGQQKVPIRSFYQTQYDQDGKLHITQKPLDARSQVSVVFMKSYNRFLILDEGMLNSTYIQLFVFENYDRDLFEPVIMNPMAKVYRLKI
jgi:undecaprenyl-diphosphooligosaccharide--protein glycosyltransferase